LPDPVEEGLILGLKEDGGHFVSEEDGVLLGPDAGNSGKRMHTSYSFFLYEDVQALIKDSTQSLRGCAQCQT